MNNILNKLKESKKEQSVTITIRLPKSSADEIDTICTDNDINRNTLLKELVLAGLDSLREESKRIETKPKVIQTPSVKTKTIPSNLNDEQVRLRNEIIVFYDLDKGANKNRDAQRKLNKMYGLGINSNEMRFENLTAEEIAITRQKLSTAQS
jgi:hypothetical protein